MNAFFQSPWLKDLGWVLVHSLWQGAILWALLALVFALGRNRLSAAIKHRAAWLTLTTLALAPALTMMWIQVQKQREAPSQSASMVHVPLVAPIAPSQADQSFAMPAPTLAASRSAPLESAGDGGTAVGEDPWLTRVPVWIAIMWLAGFALLTVRLLLGWRWVARLKHSGHELESGWRASFLGCCSRAALRHVRVLVCHNLGVPLVVGWLRPVICFPATLLTRLNTAEVEALMLHELAHLKRRDPLLQFWIAMVETLLFHNPAAHALASTVRQTGELACDDMVLAWKGDGKTYARALAAAEKWRGGQFALAASGAGSLKHRIQRILGMGEHGRHTSLPARFGITSVAGVALYVVACGLAVPQLAKALTPEERVTLIAKEKESLRITSPGQMPAELVGVGTVRTADGSKPSKKIVVTTWSDRYTASVDVPETGRTFTIKGRGDHMRAAAWVEGYAPVITPLVGRDASTSQATFELLLEKGTPMQALVVDESGNPIPGVTAQCAAVVHPERKVRCQSKLTSDTAGLIQVGNAHGGQAFEFELFAHGWQWQSLLGAKHEPGKPITLTMRKAPLISGTVLDARTQKPVSGVKATCLMRHGRTGSSSYTYGYGQSPELKMSSKPSDDSGRLTLDVCHPGEHYDVLLEAPGYARQSVRVSGSSTSFKASMNPELVLAGTLEDPERKLAGADGTVHLLCMSKVSGGQTFTDGQKFKIDAHGKIAFSFRGLGEGEVSLLSPKGGFWKATLKGNVEDLVLRLENGKLAYVSGVTHAAIPDAPVLRQVMLTFRPPAGSPPYEGDITVYSEGSTSVLKAKDNVLTLEKPVGTHLQVYAGGATGYTFGIVRQTVVSGEGPLKVDVPMKPAGAITGNILWEMPEEDRARQTEAVLLIQQPRASDGTLEWSTIHNQAGELFRVLEGGQRYFITPVDLHKAYRVVLIGDNSFAESEVLRVSEEQPLGRRDITFSRGVRVTGQVAEVDGSILRNGSVKLHYVIEGQNFQRWIQIDPEGNFVLPHLNHDMSGDYFISMPSSEGRATVTEPIKPGATNVRLKRQMGQVLEGRILDADNKPLADLQVYAVKLNARGERPASGVPQYEHSEANSDSEGRFRFTTLSEGTYKIVLVDEGRASGGSKSADTVVQIPRSAPGMLEIRSSLK